MSRFDPLFNAILAQRRDTGRLRVCPPAPDGLDFSSNDYLGLRRHPALAERASAYAREHGTGAGASRLISGTLAPHRAVEAKLASLKGTEAALLFASGWQANVSVLAALLRAAAEPCTVFADSLCHNSLHAGCRLAGVRPHLFPHNDLSALEAMLRDAPSGRRLVVTESVFSMDGDRADLPALAALARRYEAFLYVDEAHATGVLGLGGRGLSAGIPGIDCVLGTLGKALGGFGAFVAGSRALIDFLVNACGGFIYTTAPPPPVLGAADAALDLLPSLDSARARVAAHGARVRQEFAALGIDTGASTTAIIPAIVGTERTALALAEALRARGIGAIAIRPPTVPDGTARLRLSVSAAHTEDDVSRLIDAVRTSVPAVRRHAA